MLNLQASLFLIGECIEDWRLETHSPLFLSVCDLFYANNKE